MNKAAFLDRDGVINANVLEDGIPKPPTTSEEVVILDGVLEAIQLLKSNNFIPVVVTNQPDVARGSTTLAEVEKINSKIGQLTGIKHFYTCFHDDADSCDCRKPKSGLILNAALDHNIELSASFLIGDRWKDIAAGLTAGVRCFYIDYSYGERMPQQPFTRVSSLLEAVNLVIGD